MRPVGESILVVDDEPDLRDALRDLLELEGYEVQCAGDGAEAIEQAQAARPRLIVLDLMMPRMNGYEFIAELERRGLRQEFRILVLAANGNAREQAMGLGADGGIAKPFDSGDLLDEIARLIP